MKLHVLKIVEPYFTQVKEGIKTFEVRKNDRDFKVGDRLRLVLFEDGEMKIYMFLLRKIVYILDDPEYCKDGYVILGISNRL